jgi:hypothetical protein
LFFYIQLQQFRQKKDGKGGKSSSKSNKSEVDAAKLAATSEQVVDGELLEHNVGHVVASSEFDSGKDSGTAGNDVATVELSSKVGAVESSSTVSVQELPLEDSGMSDSTLDLAVENEPDDITALHEGRDTSLVHKSAQHAHLGTSQVIISEEKFGHPHLPLPTELLSEGERSILEEQVTDVGCAFSLTLNIWKFFFQACMNFVWN